MFLVTLPLGMLQTNCYLVSTDGQHLFIIDPADESERIIAAVSESGMEVSGIILTHTHFDHILAAGDLAAYYGPIEIYVHESERSFMGESGIAHQLQDLKSLVPQMAEAAARQISRLPEVTRTLRHGELIDVCGLTVFHTPGHTPGSICLYRKEDQVLFSGDTLFYGSVGRTDFPGGSHQQLLRSVRELLAAVPEQTAVYPGHGRPTTIGFERSHNPFLT
jgi:hydroxyacylglutathione hydrolase